MHQPTKSEIRYVDVPGAQLGYEVVGEGAGRRPLVMIHGYGLRSTGAMYAPLYRHLAEAFTIYALDTRGHGASAHLVDGWSFDQMAADVAAAVRNLGLSNAVHAGHSYGGFLGLLTELRHPGTFTALNLLAPAAASGGGATPEALQSTIVAHGRDRSIIKELFAGMYLEPPAPEHFDLVLDAVTLMDLRVHQTYFLREFRDINIVAELAAIKLPVLSVTGGRDVVVSPQELSVMSSLIPHAKEVAFSDEGHMLPLESPERTAREVIRFIQDIG